MSAAPAAARLLPAPRVLTAGAAIAGFDPRDIASYYSFPARADGTGTTIAVVSLYGGFRRSDLDEYFADLGLDSPQVEVIPVDGAANNPVADPAANAELVMTLELLGALAPGARLAVYLAPDTEQGVADGLAAAVFDQARRPDVVCLTWTVEEADLSQMLASAVDDTLQASLLLGVPVCAPAGLWAGGTLRPTFPGSHPAVLACGVTRAAAEGAGLAEQPVAGPGAPPAASTRWPVPRWQARAIGRADRKAAGGNAGRTAAGRNAGRLVPDVSALADEQAGYRCYVNGAWTRVGGPAAAPCLWAALLARLRQAHGQPWSVVTDLYATLGPAGTLAAVPPAAGPAGGSRAARAWDSRVGWGSPDGERILAAITAARRPR